MIDHVNPWFLVALYFLACAAIAYATRYVDRTRERDDSAYPVLNPFGIPDEANDHPARMRAEMGELLARRDLGLPMTDAQETRLRILQQWFGR